MAPQVSLQDLAGRRDLRSLITFTIDGETARDFDDAVSLELLANEHVLLGVHIADVSFTFTKAIPWTVRLPSAAPASISQTG